MNGRKFQNHGGEKSLSAHSISAPHLSLREKVSNVLTQNCCTKSLSCEQASLITEQLHHNEGYRIRPQLNTEPAPLPQLCGSSQAATSFETPVEDFGHQFPSTIKENGCLHDLQATCHPNRCRPPTGHNQSLSPVSQFIPTHSSFRRSSVFVWQHRVLRLSNPEIAVKDHFRPSRDTQMR